MSQEENINGILTLSPLRDAPAPEDPSSLAIQIYLSRLARGGESPFTSVPGTHMTRLAVIEDVARVTPGMPEHLSTAYLLFEANFDGDAKTFLRGLATYIPKVVDVVWGRCVGFPGAANVSTFLSYMKQCTIKPLYRFAGTNKKTVEATLQALRTQAAVVRFIRSNQGRPVEELRKQFNVFSSMMRNGSDWNQSAKKKEYRDA